MIHPFHFHGELIYRMPGKSLLHKLPFDEGDMATNGYVTIEFRSREGETKGTSLFSLVIKTDLLVNLVSLKIEFPSCAEESVLAVNGYQSWSTSSLYPENSRPKRLFLRGLTNAFFHFSSYGDSGFGLTSRFPRRGEYTSWYWTMIERAEECQMWASLSEKEGYTCFCHHPAQNTIEVRKECRGIGVDGVYEAFCLFYGQGNGEELWEALSRESGWARKEGKPESGWTSWYRFGPDICEQNITEVLSHYQQKRIPLNWFQIDDGFQAETGDWMEIRHDRFPGGLKPLAARIKNAGYRPGIWLAPFAVSRRSRIVREHPEWIVSRKNGQPLPVGFNPNWGGVFYALDILSRDVRNYLSGIFRQYREWGFEMFKLDFLYAASVFPRKGFSRGQLMDITTRWLRRELPDTTLLGCGMPLGNAPDFFEYLRTGSDVSPRWEDPLLSFLQYPERVSTCNALKTILTRLPYNRRAFLSDPDVYFLERENLKLNEDQRFTLFCVTQLAGNLHFTSDDIQDYKPQVEKIFLSQFPLRSKTIHSVGIGNNVFRIKFSIDNNRYLMFVNLSGNKQETTLPEGEWYEKRRFLQGNSPIPLRPHQTRVLLYAPEASYSVIGSTEMLFPGSEVKKLTLHDESSLTITWHEPVLNLGRLYIRLPRHKSHIIINERNCPVEMIDGVRVAMVPRPVL